MTYLTVNEAAKELGIKGGMMRRLLRDGRLRAKRFGRAWMIEPKDLDAVRVRPMGRPRKEHSHAKA